MGRNGQDDDQALIDFIIFVLNNNFRMPAYEWEPIDDDDDPIGPDDPDNWIDESEES